MAGQGAQGKKKNIMPVSIQKLSFLDSSSQPLAFSFHQKTFKPKS
jgi:hypothetical protein